jgi:endonuclease/exonuclease/phosphatase family metal-dependent hydrolase
MPERRRAPGSGHRQYERNDTTHREDEGIMKRNNRSVLGCGILMATAIAGASLSLPATAWADDAWSPDYGYAAFVRNNTTSAFRIQQVSQTSSGTGCTTVDTDYTFTNGTSNIEITGGGMMAVVDLVDTTNCAKSANVWRLILAKNGCSTTHSIEIRGDGSLAADGGSFTSSSTDKSLNFCGTTHTVNLFGRPSFYESGVYVTIGTDPHGKLGPVSDPLDVHKLSVTSYNAFLGTDSKPERCDRAAALASALETLDTDVLVLEEMNLREAGCFDGLELAAHLWTGSEDESSIEDDDYACSASGSGSSPYGGGAFPYISQFVSGITVNDNEYFTGGVVILSKYPVTMVENNTYDRLHNKEEKGFIVVKITKDDGDVEQDYYIVATHTSAETDYLPDQLEELASYLDTTSEIPDDARVILAGDLNTNGQAGELEDLGVDIQYLSATDTHVGQTGTQYYPHSRDSSVNFYHNNGSLETIDWVQPMSEATTGHDYADPTTFNWHVFPVRDTSFKFADLSDHFAVTATFSY